jgi:hypothetical protein
VLYGGSFEMAVFGFVLVYAAFGCFFFGVFLHAVDGGIADGAGDANCVANVFAEIDRVALDFPSAARGGGKFIFIRIAGFFQTAGDGADFLVRGLLFLI